MRFKNLLKRGLCLLLSAVIVSTPCLTTIAQTPGGSGSAKDRKEMKGTIQENAGGQVNEYELDSNSPLKSLAEGDTITIGQNGKATLSNSIEQMTDTDIADTKEDTSSVPPSETPNPENAPKDLMEGESLNIGVEETEDGLQVSPEYPDGGLVYDEEAAKAVEGEDHIEYKGSVDGSDLAAYEITPDEDAEKFSSIFSPEEIQQLREYYETDVPAGEELDTLLTWADQESTANNERLQTDLDYASSLNDSTDIDAFQLVDNTLNDSAEQEIIIIDDNVLVFRLKDQNNKGLNGVTVSIKAGNIQKTGVSRNINGSDGYVVFDGMLGTRSGLLNLDIDGYHIVTELDTALNGGEVIERTLTPTQPDEIYVRCMDVGGAEVINKSTIVSLTNAITKDYDITVLLSSGGNGSELDNLSLGLKASNRDAVVKTASPASYNNERKTRKYVFTGRWSERLQGNQTLFKAGDEIALVNMSKPDTVYAHPNLTIQNSPVTKASYQEISFSVMGAAGSFKIPKGVPGIGEDTIDFDFLSLKGTAVILLSGTAMFTYNIEIKEIINEGEFWENFYIPGKEEKAKGIIGSIKQAYNEKMKQYTDAKGMLFKEEGTKTFSVDANFKASLNAIICLTGTYDDDHYVHASAGIMLVLSGSFGMTFYAVIPPPVYVGFNASANVSGSGTIGIRFKPGDIQNTIGVDKNAVSGVNLGIGIGLSVYLGVGLHGLFSLETEGSVNLNGNLDFRPSDECPPDHGLPRITADLEYGVHLRAVALFFTYTKTLLGDNIRLYDSWGLNAANNVEDQLTETEKVYEVSFEGMAEGQASHYDESTGVIDSSQIFEDNAVDSSSTFFANGENDSDGEGFTAANAVTSDSALKYINLNGTNYAFRIAIVKYTWDWPDKEYPALVYQKEKSDGSGFENKFYQIPYIDHFYYDYDFDLCTVSEGDSGFSLNNEVMINLISGSRKDNYSDDDCAKNTIARLVRVNVTKNTVIYNGQISQKEYDGKSYKYGPSIGYDGEQYLTAWLEAPNMENAKNCENVVIGYAMYQDSKTHRIRIKRSSNDNDWNLGDYAEVTVGQMPGSYKNSPHALGNLFAVHKKENHMKSNVILAYDTSGDSLRIDKVLYADPYDGKKQANLRIYSNDVLTDGTSFLMYTYSNMLKIHMRSQSPSVTVKNSAGEPLVFPEGCEIFSYSSGRSPNGEKYMKLVTLTKETIKDGNAVKQVNSILNVYNLEYKLQGEGEFIAHGPKQYRFTNTNINRITSMIDFKENARNQGLQILYTANRNTKIINEYSENADGSESPGTIKEACTLYRWSEPEKVEAQVSGFTMDKPYIKKSEKLNASVEVENTGSKPLKAISVFIKDGKDNLVQVLANKDCHLYPGEKITLKETFYAPDDWGPGPVKLKASVNTATPESAVGSEAEIPMEDKGIENRSVSRDYDLTALDLSVREEVNIDKHYATVSVGNNSLMPTADDTKINVYKLMMGEAAPAQAANSYPLLKLFDEGPDINGELRPQTYNMKIPLDDYWSDPQCKGVLIEATSTVNEKQDSQTVQLFNPNAVLRHPVATYTNHMTYGSTEGDGFYTPGTEATVTATPRTGYAFTNWTDESGNVIAETPSYTFEVTDPGASLTANFAETGELHKVTLNSTSTAEEEGGKVIALNAKPSIETANKSYTATHGQSITVEATPVNGFTFAHWTNENGAVLSTEEEYTFPVEREITVTAVFTNQASRYSVYFEAEANLGTCDVESLRTDINGKLAALPEAAKGGCTFNGWFTEPEGGSAVTADNVFTKNTLLYAQFTDNHTHTYEDKWQSDVENHWHICTVCKEKADIAKHAQSNWISDDKKKIRYIECSICKYVIKSESLQKEDPKEEKKEDKNGVKTGDTTTFVYLFMLLLSSGILVLLRKRKH